MSAGVLAGANSPTQLFATKPGSIAVTVGRSGVAAARALPVVASARSLPALVCGKTVGKVAKIREVCSASRSVIAGTFPL